MFAADDLAVFINSDMPGYALAVINGADVDCLFRGPYQETFGMVSSNKPSILCASGSVDSVTEGAPVIVNETTYEVSSPEVDETTGLTRLLLEKL